MNTDEKEDNKNGEWKTQIMKNTDRQWMKKITMNEKDENNKKKYFF